jgi:hypothetical protein
VSELKNILSYRQQAHEQDFYLDARVLRANQLADSAAHAENRTFRKPTSKFLTLFTRESAMKIAHTVLYDPMHNHEGIEFLVNMNELKEITATAVVVPNVTVSSDSLSITGSIVELWTSANSKMSYSEVAIGAIERATELWPSKPVMTLERAYEPKFDAKFGKRFMGVRYNPEIHDAIISEFDDPAKVRVENFVRSDMPRAITVPASLAIIHL